MSIMNFLPISTCYSFLSFFRFFYFCVLLSTESPRQIPSMFKTFLAIIRTLMLHHHATTTTTQMEIRDHNDSLINHH